MVRRWWRNASRTTPLPDAPGAQRARAQVDPPHRARPEGWCDEIQRPATAGARRYAASAEWLTARTWARRNRWATRLLGGSPPAGGPPYRPRVARWGGGPGPTRRG